MPSPVYLAGAALTPFGRSDESLVDLLASASGRALEQAGLSEVDSVYLGVMNAEEFTGEGNLAAALADRLGLSGAASSRVETASSTGAGALETAFFTVASGYRQHALVVAGEKMTSLPTRTTTRILAEVIAPAERRYGASMPALAAMFARAYAYRWGLDDRRLKEALGRVASKNHARGVVNPYAQFKKEVSREEYLASRMVAEPLSLYDCAPITDGAAAVVLSNQVGSVLLAGIGHATDSAEVTRRGSFTSFNSTRQAAMQAYAMARVNPSEVDFAEVHDAFTIFEVIGSEDLGLFPPGKGWKAALEGASGPEGTTPINPSGGLKARGHPVGASGLAQVVEAYWLLTGMVQPDQKLPAEPHVALTHSIGGLGNNNLVTILTRPGPESETGETWRPEFAPEIYPLSPARPDPLPEKVYGRVRAATVLHNPPEGFAAPLGLCLVRASMGNWATLAHMDPERPLLTGARVRLELHDGFYQAFPVGDPAWPILSAQRAWRRAGALAQRWGELF